MALGRPLKFKDVKALKSEVDAYFKYCDEATAPFTLKSGDVIHIPDPKPYTITGLALFLDTSRETLLDYERNNDKLSDYSDTIRRAKLKCQNFAEESLWKPKVATGVIFNLVNNYGWRDRKEVDLKTNEPEPTDEELRNIINGENPGSEDTVE